ncbi:MAG TPA: heavy metal translocating P-type ATPase [Drouetiella sp.]
MSALKQSELTLPAENTGEGSNKSDSSESADSHSSVREVYETTTVDPAQHSIHLNYLVVHSIPGRLRLKVGNLYADFARASNCLAQLASINGVEAVRCNSWNASAVIEFDPDVLDESALREVLNQAAYDDRSVLAPQSIKVLRESAPKQFLRRCLLLLDRLLPVTAQLTFGALSFLSSVLPVPLPVTQFFLGLSALPIATRAARTFLEERKIGIDALDGIAASLMIANGRLIETGLMTALIAVGEFIREKTARRCERMVTDLLGLSGRSAWLIRGNKRIRVPADEVKLGETVVVYPGDMVPVDGCVLNGDASIDQSKLTGESMPVEVVKGQAVYASTVVVEGKIYVQCQAVGSETRAGQVLQCVANAPIHETKIQNYASSMADRLIIPIFLAAGTTFFVTRDIGRLMSMLILDFCTGIRIAAPTAVLASMHRAGRRGILVKSGSTLERMASVSAIVFDKTGTLTSGEPRVEEVHRFNGRNEDEVLAMAAAVEMRLHHPAARAIVKAAQAKGLTIPERAESEFKRGMGCKAQVGEHEVIVGSKNMMISENIVVDEARESEARATKLGESISYVAIDGKVAGLIRYSDKLRPEVVEALKSLKKLGIKKLVMATGDTEEAARRIASTCGITDVIARAFPEDKADLVKKLKAEGHTVAVIGDGINDSPALAYADVAISLHGATDAAQEGADIILTDDNLTRLAEAVRISRGAMTLVKQNLAMAIVPNGAGFGMAALGLLGPAGATIVNNGCAIAAGLNSLRPLYSNGWSAEPVAVATTA